jgi:HK97 family phage prohead protease
MAVPQFETKSFKLTELKADGGNGEFHAVANAYGVKDAYNEIVDPGACKRSLDTRGPVRKLLWQHSTFDPIGRGEFSESATALEVKGKLNLGVQRGREAYELMKAGDIDQMSIGYDVIKDYYDQDEGVRHLQEIRLWEASPVTFPANELAIIDSVKAYGFSYGDLPFIISGLTSLRGEVKQGRVLSQRNFDLIKQAASILQDLLDSVSQAEDSGKSHSPVTLPTADPQPAEQLSDSDLRSLMDVADTSRLAARSI